MSIEFEGWPKMPRLNKAGSMTVTEKIDGTNAAVVIEPWNAVRAWGEDARQYDGFVWVNRSDITYLVGAQSRKRLIRPTDDNAGFAGWVEQNAETLVDELGPGRHFGEWWGAGIQRRYGFQYAKIFSLFNTHRWEDQAESFRSLGIGLDVVPVLYKGAFHSAEIEYQLNELRTTGSVATQPYGYAFDKPEGVVIWHHELRGNLKAFVENDDVPKGLRDNE